MFTTVSVRCAAFIPNAQVSARQIFRKLPDSWLGRFDKDPVILPLEENAPAEIPRMILQSNSGEWRLDMSLARFDVYWNLQSKDTDERRLADILDECCNLLIEFKGIGNLRVGRLASVLQRIRSQENPGRYLAEHFCQKRWLDAPFNRPENFELHAHKKFHLTDALEVNSWVRNKTATKQGTDGERLILVEQDLNTLAEFAEETDFSDDEIRAFFAAAAPELDKILELYYPSEREP